jgi:hypothetical protein
MTYGPPDPDDRARRQATSGTRRPGVRAVRLWAGGVGTALVVAALAVVGLLVARGLFRIPALAPHRSHRLMNVDSTYLACAAAGAALVATGLMHVLLLTTPRPLWGFSWILGLGTTVALLWPYSTGAMLSADLATSLIVLVIGLAIWQLVTNSAIASLTVPPQTAGPFGMS